MNYTFFLQGLTDGILNAFDHFVQIFVGGVLAGFLVLAPIVARFSDGSTKPAPEKCRPQADPELLAVAHEILAEREANGDKVPSENELVEMIAERVKGKQDEV